MTTEIKAGDRWVSEAAPGAIINVIFCDGEYVFYKYKDDEKRLVVSVGSFRERFSPEKKARKINKDDIKKMLAESPTGVLWYKSSIMSDWWILRSPGDMCNGDLLARYSCNPFATNPIIVGPEIEVAK